MRFPTVENMERIDREILLHMHVDPNLLYFKGHFDDFPLLPGVVQMNWALHFAKVYFGEEFLCRSFETIKFSKPIFPDSRIQLRLSLNETSSELKFEYKMNGRSHSSGKLTLEVGV